jgi:hypothetical protein
MAVAAAPQPASPPPRPDSDARRRPHGDPTARWAAWSRVAPASAPLDGDDGAPGRGRLRPAYGGVDHWPCSRPPRLSTSGTARGGGKEEPRRGAGEGAGAALAWGGGALRCGPLPLPRRCAAILAGRAWEFHRKRWTTNK